MTNPRNLALSAVLTLAAFAAGYWLRRPSPEQTAAGGRLILYYVDPMHPAYKSDKPGIAPDCGMKLEPVYADGGAAAEGSQPDPVSFPSGTVQVSPEKQQIIGLRIGVVEKSSGVQTVRLLGRVAVDERRVYRLNAATDGWVKEAFLNSTGSVVNKDEVLATYYAPEFLSAEQAYFYTLSSSDRISKSGRLPNKSLKTI